MTIYTSGTVGANTASLEDFPSSQGAALGASIEQAWQGNPSVVAIDADNLYEANTGKSLLRPVAEAAMGFGQYNPALLYSGVRDIYKTIKAPDTVPKLDKASAEKAAQDAGVKLTIPDEGMSQTALDMLIKRQLNNRRIEDTLARAPTGIVNSSTRFLAQLATAIADPLSIASAFVPVVGEARYAQLLGNASGFFGRTAIRAGVGALEGTVGSAMLEPAIYAGRTQLQDDYTMADSLENLAFGAVFGGGLHAIGGGVADALRRATGRPFERDLTENVAANDVSALPESPLGLSDEAFAISRRIDNGTLSIEQFAKLYQENPTLAREVIAFRAGDTAKLDEAPFEKGLTPEVARQQAIKELSPDIKAQLLADAGNPAEKGVVAKLRSDQAKITAELDRLQNDADAVFRETAKDFQGQGLSRKKAESEARKQLADREDNLTAQRDAIDRQIESNAKAEQANQAILGLDKGRIPDTYKPMVDARAQEIFGKSQLQQAVALPPEASARFAVSRTSPDIRRSALSAAVAQMAEGKFPDVENIIRLSPDDPKAVAKVAESARRSTQPEASATADFAAAQSAAERIKAAPKTAGLTEADGELIKAMDRLNATQKNLEATPQARRAFLKNIAKKLHVYVEESGGGFHAGGGVAYVPPEDGHAFGALSPEHVLAHELGHSVMHNRQFSYRQYSNKQMFEEIPNWQQLIDASKKYRPAFHESTNAKIRAHAKKPDEIIADAIASVYMAENPTSLLEPMMKKVGMNIYDFGLDGAEPHMLVDVKAEMQPFDDALKTADEYGNAVRAAALCSIRS